MDLYLTGQIMREGVRDGVFSGASYALAVDGAVVALRAVGRTSFDANSSRVRESTLFDIASLTKPLVTATSILQLVERGLITLEQPAAEIITGGPQAQLEGVSVRRLLTHTSGLAEVPSVQAAATREKVIDSALTSMAAKPGEKYLYSDTGYILLGEIVARVSGTPLNEYAAANIFLPLSLANTTFLPPADAPTAVTDASLELGAVHDPRARAMGGVAGHAGVFSTAADLVPFAEAIRTGGAPLLCRASQARMAASQIAPPLPGQSYGWFCNTNPYLPSGDLFSDRSYGHSGFTGCAMLIDPAYNLSLVLLTNRVLADQHDSSRYLHLRRRFLNSIAAAVTR